jgi:2-methylisocitrate lyase-like PEP mutase family enzyme
MDKGDKGNIFRALHQAPSAFVIPNPWDIGTAKLFTSLGFKALATTSAGFAFSRGLPDGAVGFEAMIHHCREMVAATDLPVSADLERGKGDSPESAEETIFAASAAGLAGCSVEDHTGDPDSPIYEFSLAVERVAAAADAARSLKSDFVFTARCENYLWGRPDLDDTIRRLQAFDEAGADVLYAPGIADIETVAEICKAVSKPVNVLVVPGFTIADLSNAGAKRISLGSKLTTFCYGMLQTAAREMLEDGTFGFTRAGMPFAKVQELFAKARAEQG